MIALKPIVHHTVIPTSDANAQGCSVVQPISPIPNNPRNAFSTPKLVSRMYRNISPTTATPSTYGAKNTARKNVRPGNRRLSTTASPSGNVTRNGTDASVKIPVARIPCQNGSAVVDWVSNRSL